MKQKVKGGGHIIIKKNLFYNYAYATKMKFMDFEFNWLRTIWEFPSWIIRIRNQPLGFSFYLIFSFFSSPKRIKDQNPYRLEFEEVGHGSTSTSKKKKKK